VHELQRIDTLLELDVFIRELGLLIGLAQLLLDQLLCALGKGREIRAISQRDTDKTMSVGETLRGGDLS
jgi:hypothetical protein